MLSLSVLPETTMPQTPSVVKGVVGGSVTILCPYNNKDSNSVKYWCRWEKSSNGQCPLLVESQGLVQEQYEGRLALFEEPGNGTYTVILNRLTTQDAGFYWCLTNGDTRWRTTTELKVVEGKNKTGKGEGRKAQDGSQQQQFHTHHPQPPFLLSYLYPC
jgi:polymeric immunoglobulin receptor